jgi:kinetochore protein Mis13/DSN1
VVKPARTKRSITPQRDDEQPKRRRSARLSGDKQEENVAQVSANETTKSTKSKRILNAPVLLPPRDQDSPVGEPASLQVEKGRDGTKIALPFADTPVMKRNKEMREKGRKTSTGKNRRSSSGIRGRRASSLIESGTSNGMIVDAVSPDEFDAVDEELLSVKRRTLLVAMEDVAPSLTLWSSKNSRQTTDLNATLAVVTRETHANIDILNIAVPHAEVEICDFYKLIEDDMPEPKRFKQLLTWCASRALIDKPSPANASNTIETITIESARQIQEELIKDFASKSELSDWWSEREIPVSTVPKKPNPRNVKNEDKIRQLEADIARYVGPFTENSTNTEQT